MKIPIYQPRFAGNEKKYVNDCLDTTWISSRGKYIGQFEQAFATYIGAPHASTVCNGTVALHLAMLALGIGSGDEVIVPTFTYIASVNAIAYVGARPVFVDSLKETWQLNPEDVKRKITPRTRAVMAVHLYGHPCDMDALAAICRENNLFLIEDTAEAFGSLYKGKHAGSFGDISTFSFFGNKTITTGEGGMVVSRTAELHEKVNHYKAQGVDPKKAYWHDVIGYNFRMTNIAAAIGLAQLERADEAIAAKIQIGQWYDRHLSGLPVTPHRQVGDVRHTYWMYSILVPRAGQRDATIQALAHEGIETRPTFYPAHVLPMYLEPRKYPVAEDLGVRGINLPSWPGLTEENVETVAKALSAALRK